MGVYHASIWQTKFRLNMTRDTQNNKLSGLEFNVLTRIEFRGRMTSNEISRFFEIEHSEVYKILSKLRRLLYVEETKERPARYYSLRQNEN